MNIQPDFKELLALLEKHQVEYMLVGGYAVAFHGYKFWNTCKHIRVINARLNRVHSQILVNFGWLETSMLPAVPTGLKILASVPTDESVGYFHLSLRDKMHIYNNLGMHPVEPTNTGNCHTIGVVF